MKGSLRKRGKFWYLIVDVKDEMGNRKQKWINTKCEKKSEAEKELREVLSKIDNNEFVMPSKVTFTEFLEKWLNTIIKHTVEQTTWEGYKLYLDKHIIPFFKNEMRDVLLQDLQPIHLQKYYECKYKGNAADKKEGLSANSLRKHHACIKGSLDNAFRMGLISQNPADKIILPKKEKFYGSYYTAEQLELLFEAVRNTPIESAVNIAANYGLRRGEVLGLKWDAINFKEGTITIKETRVKVSGKTITKQPKSESSRRILPMINNIELYLKSLKKKQKENKLLFGDEYNDEGFVCCWDDGTPLSSEFLNHKFKKVLKANDLPHIRFHDLRHSTASLLLKNGIDLKSIQMWMGHSELSTTADIYSHIDMEMKQKAADKINDILKPKQIDK